MIIIVARGLLSLMPPQETWILILKVKKISKESLKDKDYAWAWRTSIGFYIGYKITLVLDYKTKIPAYFMIDRGSPNDTTIVSKILPILQKKDNPKRGLHFDE